LRAQLVSALVRGIHPLQPIHRTNRPSGLQPCLAQLGENAVPKYTNPETGITFNRYGVEEIVEEEGYGQGFYDFGMVLPPDALKKDANEYIGYLVRNPRVTLPCLRVCVLMSRSGVKAFTRRQRAAAGAVSLTARPVR